MDDKIDSITRTKAAGHWQEGDPDQLGRYLIEYEEYGQRRVFVADWTFHPGDDNPWQWANVTSTMNVLRWAPIHSEHVRYTE